MIIILFPNEWAQEWEKEYLNKPSFASHGSWRTVWPHGLFCVPRTRGHFWCPKWKKVKSQLCLTLRNPMDCSPPGSSVHGIFQARVLEWVAVSFSRGSSQPRDWTWVSHIIGRCFTIWATREVREQRWPPKKRSVCTMPGTWASSDLLWIWYSWLIINKKTETSALQPHRTEFS